jgi:hypothetical protein
LGCFPSEGYLSGSKDFQDFNAAPIQMAARTNHISKGDLPNPNARMEDDQQMGKDQAKRTYHLILIVIYYGISSHGLIKSKSNQIIDQSIPTQHKSKHIQQGIG